MIEKDKNYTGEQLRKYFGVAVEETLNELEKDMKEVRQQRGQDTDGIEVMFFNMQNALAFAMLKTALFKEGE